MLLLGNIEMTSEILAGLATVLGISGGAITAVWKMLVGKLNDCEKKHEAQTKELIDVSTRVARLEGINEGRMPPPAIVE